MARLFGMSSAPNRVNATFWLLDAPEHLTGPSWAEPDGTGIGAFSPTGNPEVVRQPITEPADRRFISDPRDVLSATFVAHLRHASTGAIAARNTHPFVQKGRVLAHNGVVEGLDALDERLGGHRSLVVGETDSERLFALVTKGIDSRGGDVADGITAAVSWVAANLPLYSANLVLATADELWALRYPDANDLWVLERRGGGTHGAHHLDHASPTGQLRVRSLDLAAAPAVVVASERMDEDPGWRLLDPGELVHVRPGAAGPGPEVDTATVISAPPAHPLTLDDLRPQAAASQRLAAVI